MKFGVRQCANIVFRAKQETRIGTATFHTGQPVLYIDTATTSSMQQGSSTVYAQGGRGNSRLIAWQGDKTLTFTVTDALISPVSLSMLSGAGLVKTTRDAGNKVHVHAVSAVTLQQVSGQADGSKKQIDITDAMISFGAWAPGSTATADMIDLGEDAPFYIMKTEKDGSLTGKLITTSSNITVVAATDRFVLEVTNPVDTLIGTTFSGDQNALLDYYVIKQANNVSEIQITPQDFAGYYYVEADTLFRTQADGIDMPANLTFPNVKVQSGFTIAMSGTGDPSTFDFTMDAFPGYTYFDKTKQVLCVIQVVEDGATRNVEGRSVMQKNSDPNEFSYKEKDQTTDTDSLLNKPTVAG